MTWGMFSVGWLDVDRKEKAESMFLKQLKNMKGPFNVSVLVHYSYGRFTWLFRVYNQY